MLAGHEQHAVGAQLAQHLVRRVELVGLRELRDIAGVQHERGALGERVEARDGLAQRAGHVVVRVLVEADVAVADLREQEAARRRVARRRAAEHARHRHAAIERPEQTRASPRHAAEKAAAVDAVVEHVVERIFRNGWRQRHGGSGAGRGEVVLADETRAPTGPFPRE